MGIKIMQTTPNVRKWGLCQACGQQRSVRLHNGQKVCFSCEFSLDMDWGKKRIQPLAIRKVYDHIFPGYTITEVDCLPGDFAKQIDVAGGDKMFRNDKTRHAIFVSQRFRRYRLDNGQITLKRYPEFTVRKREFDRHMAAVDAEGMVPGFYAYGYVNEAEDDFDLLYVVRYHSFLRFASDMFDLERCTQTPNGENAFYAFPWADIGAEFKAVVYQQGVNGLAPLVPKASNGYYVQLSFGLNGQ